MMEQSVAQPVPALDELEEARFVYGVIAEFDQPEDVVAAARRAHEAGYRRMDAYSPFPVEGLSDALGHRDQLIPYTMLAGGVLGAVLGVALLYVTQVFIYPLNIGGRPLFGWPTAMPITFEMTVLISALSGVLGMFLFNGLPMPYHPVFSAPNFDQATSSLFFLCIEARDPRFDREKTRAFMETLGARRVSEVELRK